MSLTRVYCNGKVAGLHIKSNLRYDRVWLFNDDGIPKSITPIDSVHDPIVIDLQEIAIDRAAQGLQRGSIALQRIVGI